jgi:hypothetical protein
VIKQLFTSPDRFVDIRHVRPHIYKHAAPAGEFAIQIQTEDGNPMATSNYLDAADISASTYFHGYIRFDLNVHLRPNTDFYVALISTGYTFSESAYIGWCNGFDLGRYTNLGSSSDAFAELDFELWENMPGNLIQKRVS